MDEPGIKVTLELYEQPDLLRVFFTAFNGSFQGKLKYYDLASSFRDTGEALSAFPSKIPDEYLYEIGSNRPEDDFAFYFALRAYTTDTSGHCAIQFTMNDYMMEPSESCRFSIKAEPWAIHRLGELMKRFSTLRYGTLKWSLKPENDALL